MTVIYKIIFGFWAGLLSIKFYFIGCLNFLIELLYGVSRRLVIIVEHMLGLGINEVLLHGVVLLPLLNIFLLIALKFFFYSFEDTDTHVLKNSQKFRHFLSISFLDNTRFFIIFSAFLNLFITTFVHNQLVVCSSYGLVYFQQLTDFYFFGPIQNFALLLDEFISFFVLLNAFVIFCCLFFITFNKSYFIYFDLIRRAQLLFLTQFFANLAFMSCDMLGFYIFYEAILIPVFFLIGIWGSSQRRIKAAYFFFFLPWRLLCLC